ncbi:MAG: S1C family serine protease, partial [Prolixibacteraceae bacterium]|nr:S1C family serine protease [Prolixibacteraceae bacterium]
NIHFTSSAYLSTDSIDYYYQLSDVNIDSLASAAPFFNLKGELIGLGYKLNEEVVLLPADYLKQAVKHLLDNTERPAWGISYIDLENNSGLEQKGNYVYSSNPSKAVLVNSPSYKAGLKAKDRIISVNNDEVTRDRTITAILQNYRLGDKIILRVARDNKEIDLEMK